MVERKKVPLFSVPKGPKRVAITVGEGAGPLVAQKALQRLKPQKNIQFILWREAGSAPLKLPSFQVKPFAGAKAALQAPFAENVLPEIQSKSPPGDWVAEAARLCLQKQTASLVTGPCRKRTLQKTRPDVAGHIELLKALAEEAGESRRDVFFVFLGACFNVMLFSGHIPLKNLVLEKERLVGFIESALRLRAFLGNEKPLAVLGLNPHAGEGGLIGREEEEILKPLLARFDPALKAGEARLVAGRAHKQAAGPDPILASRARKQAGAGLASDKEESGPRHPAHEQTAAASSRKGGPAQNTGGAKRRKMQKQLEGPLPPDTAFLKKNWGRFSFFLSLYHDQGLIPFKTVHSHTGAALSLGLPFIRTSVTHGPGFGMSSDAVSEDSMLSAIEWNLRLLHRAGGGAATD